MAHGRMISKETGLSTKIASLEAKFGFAASVFHHRLLAFLDRNGNVRAKFGSFKDELFPRSDKISAKDCEKFTHGLIEFGLAELYEVGGLTYLHFPDFYKFQRNMSYEKERDECPPLPEHIPEKFRKDSGNYSESCPPEEKRSRREVEVEVEEKRREPPNPLFEEVELWNSEAPKSGYAKVLLPLSQKRISAVKARRSEPNFNLSAILAKMASSTFLQGKNNRKWKATFDWVFCSTNNYQKILEGQFDPPPKTDEI